MTESSQNRRTNELNFALVLGFLGSSIFALSGALLAEDTVTYSTAVDPAARLKKSGTILEFMGTELRLRGTLGTDETIPAARVVEIQTQWTAAHQAGRTARSE